MDSTCICCIAIAQPWRSCLVEWGDHYFKWIKCKCEIIISGSKMLWLFWSCLGCFSLFVKCVLTVMAQYSFCMTEALHVECFLSEIWSRQVLLEIEEIEASMWLEEREVCPNRTFIWNLKSLSFWTSVHCKKYPFEIV